MVDITISIALKDIAWVEESVFSRRKWPKAPGDEHFVHPIYRG